MKLADKVQALREIKEAYDTEYEAARTDFLRNQSGAGAWQRYMDRLQAAETKRSAARKAITG